MEQPYGLVSSFGSSRYRDEWKAIFCLQLGWQRGLTLVPFIGTGVFCVSINHKKGRRK